MISLALKFNADGRVQLLPELCTGNACLRQNAVVHLLTSEGSDPVFPDRGTTLLRDAVRGAVVNRQGAEHVANFAALDTLFFMRQHELAGEIGRTIETLRLVLLTLTTGRLRFQLAFKFTNGVEDTQILAI